MNAPESSMREDIEAAFEEVVETPATSEVPATPEPAEVATNESSAVDAAQVESETPETPSDKLHTLESPRDPQTIPDGKVKDTTLHLPEKPPASWRPQVREYWGGLPKEVQAEITKREKEIVRVMTDTTESRRFHQRFQQVANPYKHIIAMEGSDEIGAFENYLKTGAVLRQGTAWEKATNLASVIKMFNVDPRLLDSALVNEMPPENYQQGQPQQFRDPRLDAILQQQEQQQTQRMRQLDDEAASDIQKFRELPTSEFFDDVEDLMSDVLTLASKRNIKMSLQEAYDRAIMIHPEVKQALDSRKAASSAAMQSGVVSAARKKVIRGGGAPTPSGVSPVPSGSDSIRGDIEAAIDRLGSM